MSIASSIRDVLKHEDRPPGTTREIKVWDVPTRIFHWSIVVLVVIAWATGEEEGTAFVIHGLAGYAVMTALIFRLIWGFIGGAYARFSSFLRPWSVVAPYAKQLAKFKPGRFVGHNPLGGWMIVLLLSVLVLTVVSGLFAQGEEGVAGPWAGSAIGLSAKQWYEVHEVSFNVLLALIFVHVVGVVVDQILTGDKLVRAMFTGIKRVGVNDKVLEATQVGFAKAMGVLATAVIATGSILGWQIPRGTAEGEHTNAQQRDHGKSMEHNERHQ